MDEQLRKRLEEAAVQDCKDYGNGQVNGRDVTAFIHGGEWMFKECGGMTVLHDMRRLILAQVKEWWKEHYHLFEHFDKEEVIADFEADMLKFWEEKK